MKAFRNFLSNIFGFPLIDFLVGVGLLFLLSANNHLNQQLTKISDSLKLDLVTKNGKLLSMVVIACAVILMGSSIVKTIQFIKKKDNFNEN